jgi:uncharacterized protein YbcC (UPF0753/DUF2309 family)
MTRIRSYPGPALETIAAAETAIGRIPPLFTLDATVAVNPYLGHAEDDLATAAARLARVAGARVTLPRDEVAARIASGEVTGAHLARAEALHDLPAGTLEEAARHPRPAPAPLPTVADLAAEATGTDWPTICAERLGHVAAAAFDRGQALWIAPDQPFWRAFIDHARRDLTPGLLGLPGLNQRADALPAEDPALALAQAAEALGLTTDAAETAFHRLLIDLGGWSQLARRPGWDAERHGETDGTALEMLAARVVWEAALLERFGDRIGDRWAETVRAHAAPVAPAPEDRVDAALHEAVELAARDRLFSTIEAPAPAMPDRPAMQAIFCIDVRSEVIRRALEAQGPIETFGFAGFFGLAVAHKGHASDVTENRLPVLLDPPLATASTDPDETDTAQRLSARAVRAWGRFKLAAVSSFAFVEAAGPLYLGKLVRDGLGIHSFGRPDPAPEPDPAWAVQDRIEAAAGILGAIGLKAFAPLVVIAGHGARVVNNPHASALQCGACGGHDGEVNARLVAGLLNDAAIRDGLAAKGIDIPADTRFVGALHDTVTDEVALFPDGVEADLTQAERWFADASEATRAERAGRLPRGGAGLMARGKDWAETRPEWALANCMAFVAAPRHRTVGRDLGGRAFLHGYVHAADEGLGVLELILTAPVVVASWISLQYHGSTLAPHVWGGGDKTLHNVVGGGGVVEGAGGRLRAGLPIQSVHDGARFVHDPLRLAVIVEAPAADIDGILARHAPVAQLFDNGWLALYRMDGEGRIAERRGPGGAWQPVGAAPRPVPIAAE